MAKHFNKNSATKEVKEFEEEVLQIDRVTRVVKGGRRLRFRATVVIGNKNGKVGVGVGKSEEVVGAIQKAIHDAKKNMIVVKMDGSTIPHRTEIKLKSAKMLLMPAAPGTGIIAGGTVRKVVEFSGIKDILSKCFGTKNKISNARATIAALGQLKDTPYSVKKRQAPKVQPQQVATEVKEEKKEEKKPVQQKKPQPKVAPKTTEPATK